MAPLNGVPTERQGMSPRDHSPQREFTMGIGISLFFLAAGAVLKYAINVDNPSGVDLGTIGVILMVVGAIGVVVSTIFWSRLGIGAGGRRETVVEEREVY